MFPYSVAIRNGFIKVGALGFQLRLVSLPAPPAGQAFAKKRGLSRPLTFHGSCPTWLAAAPI
jgi:hypothetical protein